MQDPALLHTFLNTFCDSVELSFEKVKREIFKCSVRCFIRSIHSNSPIRSTVCLYSKQRITQRGIKAYQEIGTTTLDTCNIPAAVVQQCCQLAWIILLKIILPIVFLAFLNYVLLFFFYHSKNHGLTARRLQPLRKFVCQLQEKRPAHLVHCTQSRILLKTGQEEKLYPPTDVSASLQCHP